MTASEILNILTLDEREAFLLSSVPSIKEAFDCAVTFGDRVSIRDLRLALAPMVRDRDFQGAMEIVASYEDDPGERGVLARRVRRARSMPDLPEGVDDFLEAFALVAATSLRDSKSRASQRRGRLIKDLLDEAREIEEKRRAA